jgi:hypothetical protein
MIWKLNPAYQGDRNQRAINGLADESMWVGHVFEI